MQLLYTRRVRISPRLTGLCLVGLTVALGAGCAERPTTIDPSPERPYTGVELTLAADPAHRDLIRQLASSWSARSGATVRVLDGPFDGTADMALVPPGQMPRWAQAGKLAEVPAALRSSAHPYRWDDLFSVYPRRLLLWGDRLYALPVRGEGMVLVYRKGALAEADLPATWDQVLTTAQTLGPASLPPLPADPGQLLAEFFTAAASFDRPAVGRIAAGEIIRDDFFAFQFDPATGDPRLDAPAFRYVAGLFRDLAAFRSAAPDGATAFARGEAKLGILSLGELGRIPPDALEQLGVAPVPGAGFTFDADGARKPTEQQTVNRVPYVGWGGLVGVVSASCTAPEAAWDFLADLGMPDRTSLDLIATPRWGAGPYRNSHLDARTRPRWHAFGLPAAETDRLIVSLRDNLAPGVQNYRVALRTPNASELEATLDAELRRFLGPEGGDWSRVNARWQDRVRQLPPAEWRASVRKSLGL